MTEHYDLYIHVAQTQKWASLREYIIVAQRLRLTGLGIDASSPYFSPEKGVYMVQKAGLNFFSRLSIKAEKIPQIKHLLARNRQRALIIAVETNEPNVCKWATHDHRVDLIAIDPTQKEVFDEGLANLLKNYDKPVELIYAPLFKVNGPQRSKLLRNYYKIIDLILRKRIKLIISSGATSIFELRRKREVMAIADLLGLPNDKVLEAISETPVQIVQERLEKIALNL
ncbi:MAG: RNase P subunit p30 family protein [Candidatus Heimdallarchaeota archaeon]